MKTLRKCAAFILILSVIISTPLYAAAAGETPPLSEANAVTVVNNGGDTSDQILIEDLSENDVVNVYAEDTLETLLGTATAAVSGIAAVNCAQFIANDAAGSVFVTVKNPALPESTAVEVFIPGAGVFVSSSAANTITVTNNAAGMNDTLSISGMVRGDMIRVYADSPLTSLLGYATAGTTGTATASIPQLSKGDVADTVYVTITHIGNRESGYFAVTVPSVGVTPPLSGSSDIKITNNPPGINDTLAVSGLKPSDKVRVYADNLKTSLLGSASAAASGTAIVSIPQLVTRESDIAVFITVTSTGKLESAVYSIDVPDTGTTAALPGTGNITVVNNASGASDIVTVGKLAPGDKIRLYSDDSLVVLLGSATASSAGTATVVVPQLTPGDASGTVYITNTSPGKLESSAIPVTVQQAGVTSDLSASNVVTVINNAGNADSVVVSGLEKGDKIKIYSDDKCYNLLGTAIATVARTATATIAQLIPNDNSGYIYLTVTSPYKSESGATPVEVPQAKTTAQLSDANTITVTNNAAGTNDTVVIGGLSKGDKIRIYADDQLTTLIGSAAASTFGSVTVSVSQITPGDAIGTIYITVTNVNARESKYVSAPVPKAKTTSQLSSANTITVTNNASGISDTIVIARLTQGDKIRVYADVNLTALLGTATAAASGPVTVSIPQLIQKDVADYVYITVTNVASLESDATPVLVTPANITAPLTDANNIIVTNNVTGTNDTVAMDGLSQNDKIKVFSDALLTNLLGTATATAAGTAVVKITQITPYDADGAVWITVTSVGKLESTSFKVDVPSISMSTSLPLSFFTHVVNNAAGKNDTIVIDRLKQGDKVRVYADENLTVLLGTVVATAAGPVTVSVTQLTRNDAEGTVYITVTNVGKVESAATTVDVPRAEKSLPITDATAVTIENKPAGTSDTVTVTRLSQGDKVKVFSDSLLSNLLGTGIANASGVAVVRVPQLTLKDASGYAFITVASLGQTESDAFCADIPPAKITADLTAYNEIRVTNNAAGTNDTVVVSHLATGDRIRVYADDKLVSLIGSAIASTTGTATVTVAQLTPNDAVGTVYITVANVGALESKATSCPVSIASSTAELSSGSITVSHSADCASVTITVSPLSKGDKVKVYTDNSRTALLGTATAVASASVTFRQPTPKTADHTVFVTVTNAGSVESKAVAVTLPALKPTSPLLLANIAVTNYTAGTSDTVVVTKLIPGDKIKVYSDSVLSTLIGTATASATGTANLLIPQVTPKDSPGGVYITVTSAGLLESTAVKATVLVTDASLSAALENIKVTNNAVGTNDTVVVTGLTQNDRVKVYSDNKLTNLLGTAVAPSTFTATVIVPQLTANDAAGTVYVTVTSPGRKESASVAVSFFEASPSAALTPEANTFTVTNNAAGTMDSVVIGLLTPGDRIKVYSDSKLTNLLGTALAGSNKTATIKVAQLIARDVSGTVYVTVTNPGKKESSPYALAVPQAPITSPIR